MQTYDLLFTIHINQECLSSLLDKNTFIHILTYL